MDDIAFISPARAARRLRVPRRWLIDELRAGRLPAIAAEKKLLVNLNQLTQALFARAEGTKNAK